MSKRICLGVLSVLFVLSTTKLKAIQGMTNHTNIFHLEHFQWYFQSANSSIKGKAEVPGDIYKDLLHLNYITEPLFGANDYSLRWVPRTDWTYYTTFDITKNWTKVKIVLLNVYGLDTIADVFFNDELILKANNQFLLYTVVLKNWKIGKNNLVIRFESPINYAKQRSDSYQKLFGHVLPPECPVYEFRGECHVNFIRKIQASFGWDWGPSLPTVGIWQPITVEGVQTVFLQKISTLVSYQKPNFIVLVEITVWSAMKTSNVEVIISISDISISEQFQVSFISMQRNTVKRKVIVPDNLIERWWPSGSGKQKLYNLTATIICKEEMYNKTIRIGFRTVELIQNYVDNEKPELGREFYFKINDRPIFLKGSNWIPSSAFPARNHRFRQEFLLKSAHASNMNVLRVWGGGRYESDYFYDLADELGILIWQDMMFACALYPVDKEYLYNVQDEIYFQIERLRHHPSIFIWSGNNENELGVRQWFAARNYTLTQSVSDYMKLYNETIRSIIARLDDSRPYILSSPTNGLESEKEGGVALNPSDEKYGDIHFYTEIFDLWKDSTYQIPRCSSEYGVQSFPRKETMLKWLNESDWSYTSKGMQRRQHHPGGFIAQLLMIFAHFRIPNECENKVSVSCEYFKTSTFMDRFVYLSQFHQAIAYQIQTEHYRRWSGHLTKDGRGHTMCALYWQLNDLWAAPTWSSIDYELSWKPVQYFARRFFAPVILSIVKNDDIHLFLISDLIHSISDVTVILEIYACCDSFKPIHFSHHNISLIPPQSSTEISIGGSILQIKSAELNNKHVLRAKILSSDGTQIGYDAIHLSNELFVMDELNFGIAHIREVNIKSDVLYEIEVNADKIAPLVYLELASGLVGWFSDNAFTMTEAKKIVQLFLFKQPKRPLVKNDIMICSLRNCGRISK
ncbi:unnamed protein product [Thelazia callipaeda]|uniref:Beta-mannosidase n=1 Tax=Thelazia callipaeda TaxID=103827 RepID=A0A0N5D9W5_THECL|nr:unnamed protein product [Thelazia callipaeda]